MTVIRGLLISMRPRQWTKNLIVFAALIFDLKLFDLHDFVVVTAAFVCFCLASSAMYLINDVLDRERDRVHPAKRHRPIAAGIVNEKLALATSILLLTAGVVGALFLQPQLAAIIVLYLALMVSYSVTLKHLVIIDVFAIAAGFVLRAAGGAVVVDVPISPWLYVCTVLLSLFIGFGKRRSELIVLEHVASSHRRNLDEYSLPFLDQLLVVTSATTLMAYSLYTFVAPNLPADHTMMLTIPFVAYGIFRYLFLVINLDEGGSPERLLLEDRPLTATVGLWALTAVVILYHPWS